MCDFNELFLEETRREYRRLYKVKPYSASAYLREVATKKGVSRQTLTKHLNMGLRMREVSITTQARQAEIDSYVRMIWEFSVNHSFDLNKITVQVAYEHLMREERLPKTLTMGQVYASMSRQKLRNNSGVTWKKIPETRKPMDTWQMDFSKSRYFKHRISADGEIECVDPVTTKRQDDGHSLWFGVAIDMASRVIYVEYFLSPGENAESVIEFSLHAFDAKPGMMHLQGVPKSIYVDNGPGWVNGRTASGLKKIGVKEILGGFEKDVHGRELKKRNKKGRGQVERTVNTLKNRMEASLYLAMGKGRKLYVKDLNEALSEWLEEWNQGPHPMDRAASKLNVFMEHSGKQFENLIYPPDDSRALFSRSIMKTVARRKILVAKNTYAYAPAVVDDGEEVEIVRNQTGYYIFKNGEMHKLAMEAPMASDDRRATPTPGPRIEMKDAKLADLALRKRFDEELLREMGLTIGRMSDDEWNDIAPFFEAPRSIREIEEQVKMMMLTKAVIAEKPLSPIARPSNIIQLPPEGFIRGGLYNAT